MSIREVVEGNQTQGEDERVVYNLNISKWGNTPTGIVVVVKDENGDDVTRDVTALVMASRARHSNVATITTDTPHGLTTLDHVAIFDCGNATYDADDVAVTVTGPTTFTYANTGAEEATTVETAGRVETPTSATATAPTTTSIQLPRILMLIAGREYRVEVKFTVSSNVLEVYFIIVAEE